MISMTRNETDDSKGTVSAPDPDPAPDPTSNSIRSPAANSDMDNIVDGTDDLNAKLAALTGAEHFLVGLTPHYWAHIPMLISDVHHLGLVNGVSCIVECCDHCSTHVAASVAEIGRAHV